MEGSVLDAVAVDLSYVKIFLDLFDFSRDDVVSRTPDKITFGLRLLFFTR